MENNPDSQEVAGQTAAKTSGDHAAKLLLLIGLAAGVVVLLVWVGAFPFIRRLVLEEENTVHKLRHPWPVWSVAWSPDGVRLASSAYTYGQTIVWDTRTGKQLLTMRGQPPEAEGREMTDAVAVAWSPDGALLASGSGRVDGSVVLWDAETGDELRTLNGLSGLAASIAWSPNGTALVAGQDDKIIVWDVQSGERLLTLQVNSYWVNSVAWSPDGELIASAEYHGPIILWDAETGEIQRAMEIEAVTSASSVGWSPDGAMLAAGVAGSEGKVIVWDAHSGQRLRTLEGDMGSVLSVAWSPDGRRLAAGTQGSTVMVWDVETGDKLHTFDGHTDGVMHVAWSPNGRTIASCAESSVLLWNVNP